MIMKLLSLTILISVLYCSNVVADEDIVDNIVDAVTAGFEDFTIHNQHINPSIVHFPCNCSGTWIQTCTFHAIHLYVYNTTQVIAFEAGESDILAGKYAVSINNASGKFVGELEDQNNQPCEHEDIPLSNYSNTVIVIIKDENVYSVDVAVKTGNYISQDVGKAGREMGFSVSQHHFVGYLSGFTKARLQDLLAHH